MKRALPLLCLIFLFLAPVCCLAQNPREASIKFMGGQQNAVLADFDAPQSVVEEALKDRLDRAGLGKAKSEKGFRTYQATTWKEVAPDKVDVYTRVDGKGDKSTVVILISKGYNNFVSAATDPEKISRVQSFLSSFARDVKAYQVRQEIGAQEETVRRAEKEFKKSVDDGEKLVREREKIEKEIVDNKTYQATKQTELNLERDKLEQLKRQL